MDHAPHSSIVSFIWNIADDVLRDLYVRGKYRGAETGTSRNGDTARRVETGTQLEQKRGRS
jgi:type I restriction-modification system DNA methylase subunit